MYWETAAESLPLTHGTAVLIGAVIVVAVVIALLTAFAGAWKDDGPLRTIISWGGEAALIAFFFVTMEYIGGWSIPATLALGWMGWWTLERTLPREPRKQQLRR